MGYGGVTQDIEGDYIQLKASGNGGMAYVAGTGGLGAYRFTTDVSLDTAVDTISILGFYQDKYNYVACDYKHDQVIIKSYQNGEVVVDNFIKLTSSYEYGDNFNLGIALDGNRVECLLNDSPVLVFYDNKLKRGGVGIKLWDPVVENQQIRLSNVFLQPNSFDYTGQSGRSGIEIVYSSFDEGKLEIADEMLQNIYTVDRFDPVSIDSISWREDPYGEQYWRFLFYSLQPSKNLLAMWLKTGNPEYVEKLKEILHSYFEEGQSSPYGWDRHGAAYRTMVLVNSYKKLDARNELDHELRRQFEDSLLLHGRFLSIENNYEGDYNHGVDQAIALYLLTVNFPDLDTDGRWRGLAESRIHKGLLTIVDDDGVLVENSPYYHFYVLNKYWQLFTYLEKNELSLGVETDNLLESRLDKMVSYATYILQPDLSVPKLGASIEDTIERYGYYAEIAEEYPQFNYVLTKGQEGERPRQHNVQYDVAGQSIFRTGWSPTYFEQQGYVTFDTGAYRTDHSDLDALSFTLFANGINLLPDSGLYTYEPGDYRSYFHGTRAHNTVVVDGMDQRDGVTADGDVTDRGVVESDQVVVGSGYVAQSARHTLYPDTTHNRSLVWLEDKVLLVVDHLDSSTEHTYEQMFHLFPGAEIQVDKNVVKAFSGNKQVMTIRGLGRDGSLVDKAVRNLHDPVQGLCATTYEAALPCYAVSYRQEAVDAHFITAVVIGDDSDVLYETKDDAVVVTMGASTYTVKIAKQLGKDREIIVDKPTIATPQSSGTLVDDMSSLSQWSVGAENLNSDSLLQVDNGSFKLYVDGNDGEVTLGRDLGVDMLEKTINVRANVSDVGDLEYLDFQLSNNNWDTIATFTVKSDVYPETYNDQWLNLSFIPSVQRKLQLGSWYFSDSEDNFDWTNIDQVRFRLRAKDDKSATVRFDDLILTDAPTDAKMVIVFDDGWDSVMGAKSIMDEFGGIKGNIGVNAISVGKRRYLTLDQLRDLQNNYGWGIANHSELHKDAVEYYYANDNLEGLEADITNGLYFLEKNGINSAANWYIYPNGKSNTYVADVVSKYYSFGRATQDAPERYPFSNPHAVKVFSVYSDRVTASEVIDAIDDAIEFDQDIFLMFHKFADSDPEVYTEFDLNDFRDIISHVSETGIETYTFAEFDASVGVSQPTVTIHERVPERVTVQVTK
ncbi:MAG: heparinase II/III domain-containing protein [Patescibacteria group bacterium]